MTGASINLLLEKAFQTDHVTRLKILLALCSGRILLNCSSMSNPIEDYETVLSAARQSLTPTLLKFTQPAIACQTSLVAALEEIATRSSRDLISDMAEHYEQLIEPEDVGKHGVFYTPRALAHQMCIEALALFGKDAPESIADISAGSGIFLIEILRALQISPQKSASNLTRLYGVDRDTLALECARLLLELESLVSGVPSTESGAILKKNIKPGNSLISPDNLIRQNSLFGSDSWTPADPFSFQDSFPDIFKHSGGFDLIIGNPPYGLSRDQRINTEETALLKRIYQKKIRGRVNTYLLFVARAYELLSPKGVLSLIVPNAWLGIDEALPIRKLLIDSGALCTINTYSTSPFGKLGVEVITFLASKRREHDTITINTFSDVISDKPERSSIIPRQEILRDPSRRISLKSALPERDLITTIECEAHPLGGSTSEYRASIALQAYAKGRGSPPQTAEIVKNHPFHLAKKTGRDCIPYLEGKDVQRLNITWEAGFLHYGPWLAEYPPLERYTSPRILVREILAPFPRLFYAAYTDQPFTYNRSILHIHARLPAAVTTLPALALVLNSRLAGFWLSIRGRKSQRRLFPKIVSRDLNEFPISGSFSSCQGLLSEKYEELMLLCKSDQSAQMELVLNQVDEIIYDLYQLSVGQKEYLRALS